MVEINPDAPRSKVRPTGNRERRRSESQEPAATRSSFSMRSVGKVATILEGFNTLRHLFTEGSTWLRVFTHAAVTTALGYFSFKSSGDTQQ